MEPFIAEIKIVSFDFAPKGWALCNGQLLAINQNQALFSLLGTTYGGNGVTTFGLPNLQCRVPIHYGQGPGLSSHMLGEVGGEANHTLTTAEMPTHPHGLVASTDTGVANLTIDPSNAFPATSGNPGYSPNTPNVPMASQAVGMSGGGQPHENRPPYLVLNYVIALVGVFPSRN